MKDASNFGLRLSNFQSVPQIKKELEECEKELAEANNLINKKSKPISFSFSNNDLPSSNDLLAEHNNLLSKIWKLELEKKRNQLQERLAKLSEIERKEHQKELEKSIKQIKIRQEESVFYEPIYPVLPPRDRNFFGEKAPSIKNLSDKKIPSPPENTSIYKPSTGVSIGSCITPLFWLVALLLVISFLFRQDTNEKQEKNKQGYLQRNVPVVLDTQTASAF